MIAGTDKLTRTTFTRVNHFLNRPDFDGFTNEDLFIRQFVPGCWGQDIAALSNMAEALRNLADVDHQTRAECRRLLTEVVERAIGPGVSPWVSGLRPGQRLGDHGYYLEHLNIILGCYQSVADDHYAGLAEQVTEHLARQSTRYWHGHARLLPRVGMRWCADQAAIIYSLWLFDANNGTDFHRVALDRWLPVMQDKLTHRETGLFRTEALGVKEYSHQPRGCSIAYLVYYLSHYAPDVARDQWERFKHHMLLKRVGLTGFREYLPTYRGRWTPDSGPIIAGMGVAASALAMKTARVMGDQDTFRRLEQSAKPILSLLNMTSRVPVAGRLARIGTDLLSSSIWLAAQTTPVDAHCAVAA